MTNIPLPLSDTQSLLKAPSAGEFVQNIAEELQHWLDGVTLSGAANGKRWVLSAILANGSTLMVRRLSAHGQSMVKLEGVRSDGTLCFLFAHYQCIQMLAYLVSRKSDNEEQPRREIGFHTGLKDIKIEQ